MSAIELNNDQLTDALELLQHIGLKSADALRIGINKAGPKTRTLARKRIRQNVRLSLAYVAEKLKFISAKNSNLNGRIWAEKRGVRMTKYDTNALYSGEKVSWVKPPPMPSGGIKLKIKPSEAAVKVAGDTSMSRPFYMVGKNSHALLIVQRSKDGKIHSLYSPSVSQVFQSVREDVMPEAAENFQFYVADAIRYLIQKQNPPEPTANE